jgi:predicted nucleic acid-binding protein
VLAELYAGADERGRPVLERLQRDFDGVRRVLVPNLTDWNQAGTMLARLGRTRGFEEIKRARMTNDALIAASAARMGITVITANERDFGLFAELCPLRWKGLQEWNRTD